MSLEPLTPDRAARMIAKLKLWGLQTRMNKRLDRCCHGGEVSDRLPFLYRLDVANRRYPASPPQGETND